MTAKDAKKRQEREGELVSATESPLSTFAGHILVQESPQKKVPPRPVRNAGEKHRIEGRHSRRIRTCGKSH